MNLIRTTSILSMHEKYQETVSVMLKMLFNYACSKLTLLNHPNSEHDSHS